MRLSVVLATYNEAANLGRCLESVKDIASEIVVVDGQSTDSTPAIAQKFGVKVITVHNQLNFHINKNKAIDAATGDWILQLDADEVVSPELAAEIVATVNSHPTADGYWLNRKNWFLTKFLTKGGQYPDPTLRLYRRGKGRLPAKDVHEQAVVSGPTGRLTSDLLHYRDTDFAKYLDGLHRYSAFMASQMTGQVTIDSVQTFKFLLVKPMVEFVNIFLRHKGYVDGFPGFVFALFSALRFPLSFIRYWQITKYPA